MAISSSRRSKSKKKPSDFFSDRDSYPKYRDFGRAAFDKVNRFFTRYSEDSLLHEDPSGRNRGGKKGTFLKMLYQMVDDAEDQDYTDVIAWMPHGRSFVVKDKHRFTNEILPMHFGSQNSFASFQRQLNVYGFLRMTKNGPDRKSYYHELFLRGREDLIAAIPRRRKTTAKVRRSLDPMTEPNLYAFPPCIPAICLAGAIPEEMTTSSSLTPAAASPEETPPCTTLSSVPRFTFNPSPDMAVSSHHLAPELALSGEESSNASSAETTSTKSPVHNSSQSFDNFSTNAEIWQHEQLLMGEKPCCIEPDTFREEEYHIVAYPEDAGFMASFHEDEDLDRF